VKRRPARARKTPRRSGTHAKPQGKASGTSRLNLEDYLQRPEKEGGFDEANYVLARAEREYEYTIDNRGCDRRVARCLGQRAARAAGRVDRRSPRGARGIPVRVDAQPEVPRDRRREKTSRTDASRACNHSGDRAAYEKATAELRATFQAIAAFALQVALAAVIGPAVLELAALAEIGEGAAMGLRIAKIATEAAVGTGVDDRREPRRVRQRLSLAMLEGRSARRHGWRSRPRADRTVRQGTHGQARARSCPPEIVQFAETVAGIETGALAQGEAGDLSPTH
jgi:hypothetical protein